MSFAYRQTLSDDLAPKVEEQRRALGLSIQEITVMALALFCHEHKAAPAPTPVEETRASSDDMLSFD